MTATLTLDEAGRLVLPEDAMRTLGMKPGAAVKVEVMADRIEITRDIPVVTETARSPTGRLVLARTGIPMSAAAVVREQRNELAARGLKR